MIVRRILLENAGPFLSDWEVELPEGVTAIVGEYDDAVARSNRAGKSFLAVDGLLYVLFGKFRARTDDFVHRVVRGREAGFVEYELESSEGVRFVLRRGRDRSGAPIRLLDGAEIKDDAFEEVVREEILGLSYDEFTLTNCFVQGRMHAFMEMTPTEKRRVVSPWFRTDRWIPRFELAKSRLTATRRRFLDLEREQGNLQGHVERTLSDVAEVLPGAESELAVVRGLLDEITERRAVLLAEIESDATSRKRRSAIENVVAAAEVDLAEERLSSKEAVEHSTRDLDRARKMHDDARGRADQIVILEREVARRDEFRRAVDEIEISIATHRVGREESKRERLRLLESYERLTADRTGSCPILREPCSRVERDEEVVAGVRQEGLCARRAIDRAEKRITDSDWKLGMSRSDLAGIEDSASELEELRAGVSVKQCAHDLERARRRLDGAEAKFSNSKLGKSEAGRALRAARKSLEALPEASDDEPTRRLAEIAGEREDAERRRDAAEREVAEIRALEASGRSGEARLEEIATEIGPARAEVERLAWAAYAFGATGIPSRELENAFGVAEDSMNSVLEDLRAPTRLRFSPSRELKDWEPACLGCGETYSKGERTHVCPDCGLARRKRRRDELRLEVLDGATDSTFEMDSGGGKVLLSLGARFGLARLPGATRRVRCESAVVDEPDGVLDSPNRAALYRLLRDRLPTLGIRQTLLITHADVRDEFESVVVVRRFPDEDRSGFWRE